MSIEREKGKRRRESESGRREREERVSQQLANLTNLSVMPWAKVS